MKHKKKPTVQQRKLMQKWKLNAENWMVERDTPTEMVLVHKHFDSQKRVVPKEN